jgi:uncharacterized protein YfbU (UPF0304 family)
MFNHIKYSIELLKNQELNNLDRNKLQFRGFDSDSNNEYKHYRFLKFIINECNKFDDYKNLDLDSHDSTTLIEYRELLKKYTTIVKNQIVNLTLEEIILLSN